MIFLSLLLSLNLCTQASAQKKNLIPTFQPSKVTALKKRRAPLMSKREFRQFRNIESLMEKKKFSEAQAQLNKLLQNASKPFQKARVHQALARLYVEKEQMGKAIESLNSALKLKVLPLSQTLAAQYNTVQILASQGKAQEALKKLENWFTYVEKPQATAHVLYAGLLFGQGRKKQALTNINHALQITTEPQESWLKMAVALNYDAEDYKKSEKFLRQLIEMSPKKNKYWKQLSSVTLQLEQADKSLSVTELSRKQGFIKKNKEALYLSQLYIQQGIPFKSAQLIEKFLKEKKLDQNRKNYELLAQAWIQAEEPQKALEPLKKASTYAKDGLIDLQLAQVYIDQKKWNQALNSLKKALEKGKLNKKTDHVHLMSGICLWQMGQKDRAFEKFKQAAQSEQESIANNALKWLQHVTR